MKRKNQPIEIKKMSQEIELTDKYIKTVMITVFHTVKKVEDSLKMLRH